MKARQAQVKQIQYNPNILVNVVGQGMGRISANKVEAIIDSTMPEHEAVLNKAVNENKFQPLVTDKKKIKSLIIMENGNVYPSTFRASSLIGRIYEATTSTTELSKLEEGM